MADTSTLADLAEIVGAAFTALAAGAAWKTVTQGQRLWRAGLEGNLLPQVLLNQRTSTTDLVIHNAGGGLAHAVTFVLVAGDTFASERVGDGFMRGGAKANIHTDLPASLEARCIVMWRNVDESSFVTAPGKDRLRLRKGRHGPVTTDFGAWRRGHPDHDLSGLRETPNVQIELEQAP